MYIFGYQCETLTTKPYAMKKILLFLLAAPTCWAQLPDLFSCDFNGDSMALFDLSAQTPLVLNGGAAGDYSVSYYQSLNEAEQQWLAITNTFAFTGYDGQIIYARRNELATGDFIIQVFDLETGTPPLSANVTVTGQMLSVIVYPSGEYEYSLDGINFQASPTFNNVSVGSHDITIRALNGCGELVASATVLGLEQMARDNFSLWPNPVADVLHLSNPEAIDAISVSDVSGKTVAVSGNNGKEATVNMAHLPNGIYLVRATVSGTQQIFKVVKQ